MHPLDRVDLSLTLSKKQELARLDKLQRRLLQLRLATAGCLESYEPGPPIVVVMEGWDAAGKGGTIKRVCAPLDARHYQVAFFSKPTKVEKEHTFLWRFYPSLPSRGEMTVYDRSWYGRVLVERVEGFATENEWRRAYQEINDFEKTLTDDGAVVVKYWLHISHDEQARRFVSRQHDPLRAWKLVPEDWRNREKRGLYEAAVEDMLEHTDQELAPWQLISAESKRHARVEVLESLIARLEDGLLRWGSKLPRPLD